MPRTKQATEMVPAIPPWGTVDSADADVKRITSIRKPRKPRKPAEPTPAELVAHYGWYIDRAFDFRKREIEKQVAKARETVAKEKDSPHNTSQHAQEMYESLENMASHLEGIQREFNAAHDALMAAGLNKR